MPAAECSMTCVAPTIARCLGVRAPADGIDQPIEAIVGDLEGCERLAVLAPDALGRAALDRLGAAMPWLSGRCAERSVTLRSVLPSITPVNFAAMVSGCDLDGHGVASKEMDFTCETLFGVLAESGLEGAGCGRPGYTGAELLARVAQIDGTAALPDDAAIEEIALGIARDQRPAFIIAQIGGTDDHFHRFGPYSPRMIPKLAETDGRLERMVAALGALHYSVVILADHGQHESGNPEKMGTHGTDSDEDCLVPCTWIAAS